MFARFLCLLALAVFSVATEKVIELETTEAFDFAYHLDNNNTGLAVGRHPIDVVAAEVGHADVPKWMSQYRRPGSNVTWLYGTPDEDGDFDIEMVLLDSYNFDTYQDRVKFRVSNKTVPAAFEVQIRLFDLDVEDFFVARYQSIVEQIFALHLWRTPHTVYVTKVCRPEDVHTRAPLDPADKEGVMVRVGSAANFSRDLLQLNREVRQLLLRRSPPCPRNYKKTSVEHVFRKQGLMVDWCSFQLITL